MKNISTNIQNLNNKVNAFIVLAKIKKQLMNNKLIVLSKNECIKEGKDYNVDDPFNEEEWDK